jgi:hypothetical protein
MQPLIPYLATSLCILSLQLILLITLHPPSTKYFPSIYKFVNNSSSLHRVSCFISQQLTYQHKYMQWINWYHYRHSNQKNPTETIIVIQFPTASSVINLLITSETAHINHHGCPGSWMQLPPQPAYPLTIHHS